jgi:hypothetical protein
MNLAVTKTSSATTYTQKLVASNVAMPAGTVTLRATVQTSGVNFKQLQFVQAGSPAPAAADAADDNTEDNSTDDSADADADANDISASKGASSEAFYITQAVLDAAKDITGLQAADEAGHGFWANSGNSAVLTLNVPTAGIYEVRELHFSSSTSSSSSNGSSSSSSSNDNSVM